METIINKNASLVQDEAKFYTKLGWFPIPGKVRSKRPPDEKGWDAKTRKCEPIKVLEAFSIADKAAINVGLLVGKHCVDIDLDSVNSRRLAPYLLPKTINLRRGNRITHYLYTIGEEVDGGIQTRQFMGPGGGMLCEIRGLTSTGKYQYTMCSPSIHPDGDIVERIGEVPHVIQDAEALLKDIRLLAVCDVMLSNWGAGSRNTLAMGLAGFLTRHGYDPERITTAIAAICEQSGDDENRAAQVKSTLHKHENGQNIAGEKLLREALPTEALDCIRSWFDPLLVQPKDYNIDDINLLHPVDQFPYLAYLIQQDRYTTNGTTLLKRTQVAEVFAQKFPPKALSKLLTNCPKLTGLGYAPSRPLWYEEGNNSYWNTWRGTEIQPKPGPITLFHELINFVCDGDIETANVVIRFLAHAVKHPGEKVRWMPIFIGGQGTGKTTICEFLCILVGTHNTASIPAATLIGNRFTGILKDRLVVCIEELRISHMAQSKALATVLKEKVTNDTILINEKNMPEYEQPNRIRFIGCSNYQVPMEIETNDRRYYPIISDTAIPGTELYALYQDPVFKTAHHKRLRATHEWFKEGGGAEAVLHYLLNEVPLDDFACTHAPNMTHKQLEHKRLIQQETSSPEFTEEVKDTIDFFPSPIFTLAMIHQSLQTRYPNARLSTKRLSPILRSLGLRQVKSSQRFNGRVIRLNLFCDPAQFKGITDAQVVQQFQEVANEALNTTQDTNEAF